MTSVGSRGAGLPYKNIIKYFVPLHLKTMIHAHIHTHILTYYGICVCMDTYILGRDGALVEAMTLNRRVVGSTPALAVTLGPWASPLPAVACGLRRETPIQYPCCSRESL